VKQSYHSYRRRIHLIHKAARPSLTQLFLELDAGRTVLAQSRKTLYALQQRVSAMKKLARRNFEASRRRLR
jgi:hypothetical protein